MALVKAGVRLNIGQGRKLVMGQEAGLIMAKAHTAPCAM